MNLYETLLSESEISIHRKKWINIGLATGPTDWNKAERGIKLIYQNAGLKAPSQILKLDSPLAGAIAAQAQVEKQVRNQVRNQVQDQVWDQVRNQVSAQVSAQVRNQVSAQVWNQVSNQVQNQVSNQVWYQVSNQVQNQVWKQVRDQVSNQICYGSQDAHWLSYLTIFSKLECVKKLEGLILLAESTGWFWPFEDVIIMTERPSRLIRKEGKARYIEYPDGFFIAPNANEMEVLAYASL